MNQVEDMLESVLKEDGFATLALLSTGEGLREWTYYSKSETEFMARLNLITQRSVVQIHPPATKSKLFVRSGYVVYVAFLLRHAFPHFGSIGSNDQIESHFACSQTAIFKFLIGV